MKKTKRLAFNVFSLILTFIMTVCIGAFFGCDSSASKSDTLAFNDNMQFTFYVNETIDLTEMVDWPEGERAVLKAEYEEDGQIKQYSKVALTFKPTKTGEVTITITCGEQSITEKIAVIEQLPTLLSVDEFTFEKGETVTIESLKNGISVLPIGTSVKITKYRYAQDAEMSLVGVETVTFDRVGIYTFGYEASNSSGKVEGAFDVNVTREMTDNEIDDITNTIQVLGISSVEQVDEHSVGSSWSWKVTAHSSGTYANGSNSRYWNSRVSVLFDQPIDLAKQYVEFDVFASENTYEGGVLINYATGRNQALYSNGLQMCPMTAYNTWVTVSTSSQTVKSNPEATKIKPVGLILSVLHKQQGDYNPEEVYMLLDNMRICEYPVIGENEINDYTNKGLSTAVSGVSLKLYKDDKIGDSDWSYKLSTREDRKASDYAVADISFGQTYNASQTDFSFFVKPNASFELENFKIGVLYNDANDVLKLVEYNMGKLEAGSWNYISSSHIQTLKHSKFHSVRFYINTVTTTLKDAELLIDNLCLFDKSANEENDLSDGIKVNQYNDVEFVMEKNDVSANSDYAWQITGKHFDYFTINFDKTYAFGNSYLTFDIKNVDNFGGKVLAQFIAGDGTVKQDWLFENVATSGWTTLSTQADTSVLLANYKAVNLFLWGEDSAKDVKVIIDNVSVKSRDNAEYFGVSADSWLLTDNLDGTTTVNLKSYVGGEKYVQLAKQGGYNNEFIDVDLTLNGTKNADIAIGMRVETPYNYASIYGKQGFYIRFNDGFFTLYGPTFLGTHCGSYNYPNGMENCTKLRVGIINNNNYVQAYLYFMKADETVIGEYTWTNYNGNPINPEEVKNGSFIIYSLNGVEREFTISDPFGYVPAPKLTANGMSLDLGAKYADKYLISINGAQEFEHTNGTYTFTQEGAYVVSAKAVVGETVSETATIEMIATERPIEILNATAITLTPESDTKGEITFTSPTDSNVNTSGGGKYSMIKIGENLTDEFIKVGFTTPADLSNPGTGDWSVFMANTLGISGRIDTLSSTNPAIYYYNVLSSPYGGGLKLNANGQSVYAAAQPEISGQCLVNNGNLTLAANTKYYYLYGLLDDDSANTKEYRVYFALLDASGNVIRAYHWSKSFAENVHNYFATAPRDSGSFVISSALKGISRTLTYEIISKDAGLEIVGANVLAPNIVQNGKTISWATGWANGYEVKFGDNGTFEKTTDTSMQITTSGNIYVKAYNGHITSPIATVYALLIDGDIQLKNATNLSSSSALTYTSGEVSFVNNGTAGGHMCDGGTQLWLKKQYTDELIKLKFVAKGASVADQKLLIGLRQTSDSPAHYLYTWTLEPTADHGVWIRRLHGSTSNVLVPMTAGFGATEVYGSSLSWKTMLTAGDTYYMIGGVVGTGDNAVVYYGILDESENLIKLAKLPWSIVKAKAESMSVTLNPLADSGYYLVQDAGNIGGAGKISYEMISETELLSLIPSSN